MHGSADSVRRAVTAVSGDLRFVTAQVRSGNGTVGKLFTDRAVYDTLLQTVRRTDAMLTQVQVGAVHWAGCCVTRHCTAA